MRLMSCSTISALAVVALLASPARAETVTLIAHLNTAIEVPSNDGEGTGTVVANYDTGSKLLSWNGSYSGLTGTATAAHFYGPTGPGKNAGVAIPNPTASFEGSATLTDARAVDLRAGRNYANVRTATNPGGEIRPTASFEGSATLTDAQAAELLAGFYYVKVHTASHPGGEIRGQVIRFDQLWLSH